jgi:hypothetical protein
MVLSDYCNRTSRKKLARHSASITEPQVARRGNAEIEPIDREVPIEATCGIRNDYIARKSKWQPE